MFKRILIGVDGREGGRDAIALGGRLLADGGRLTLANVYPGEGYVWRGGNPAYTIAVHDDAMKLLTVSREEGGIGADLRCIGTASIGHGLHTIAEEIGADLLVVGSSRRGLVGRVLLGDDTRAALDGAPCAVAVAPADYDHRPPLMREIGVGYNGSPESKHALDVARELAAEYGARLSAFEAVSLPASLYLGGPAPVHEGIEAIVDAARDRVQALGDVEPHAAYGVPAEELALYSASLDLLVLGSRGYGPVGRLVHGSTSRQLARAARCPLLVLAKVAASSPRSRSGHRDGVAAEA